MIVRLVMALLGIALLILVPFWGGGWVVRPFAGLFGADVWLLLSALLLWVMVPLLEMRDPPAQPGYTLSLVAVWLGNLGAFFAYDPALFYTCYALAGVASWGLMHRGARSRAQHYLLYVLLGESLVIAGLFFVAHGTAPLAQTVLLLLGFGVKIGLFPLHGSLPLGYTHALGRSSIALSGALLGLGVVGMLRFIPWGQSGLAEVGGVLFWIGCAGVIVGLLGVLVRELPAMLAHSSIAQMGAVAVVLACALMMPHHAALLLAPLPYYLAFHGLAKGTLMLALHAPRTPLVLLGAGLAGLSLGGMPLSLGSGMKSLLAAPLEQLSLEGALLVVDALGVVTLSLVATLILRLKDEGMVLKSKGGVLLFLGFLLVTSWWALGVEVAFWKWSFLLALTLSLPIAYLGARAKTWRAQTLEAGGVGQLVVNWAILWGERHLSAPHGSPQPGLEPRKKEWEKMMAKAVEKTEELLLNPGVFVLLFAGAFCLGALLLL